MKATRTITAAEYRATQTEAQFQAAVIAFAELHGWRVYHTWNSQHSAAGFFDLVLIRGSKLLFVELKTTKGTLTAEQYEWGLDVCLAADEWSAMLRFYMYETARPAFDYYLWSPNDWDAIERVLA